MAQVQINNLYNANIYAAGNSFIGKAEEVTLPAIKAKTRDVKALGLISDITLPSGLEKMTAKIKWNSIYPEVASFFGNPFQTQNIQIRSSLENWDAGGRENQLPVVAYMKVAPIDSASALNIKQNENPDQESELNVYYYRLEVDGNVLYEVDVFNNVFMIDGVDQMVQWRKNMGQQ